MDVTELGPEEQRTLVGLVKLVVHADQVVSAEEREVLARLQATLGAETWNERVRAASDAFPTVAELEAACLEVTRPEAQACIHAVLDELAGSDELIEAEAHVLQWLDEAWGLTPLPDDEPSDAVETFVFMEED